MASLADNMLQTQIKSQEQGLDTIREKITKIKADAKFLNLLTVGFDIKSALLSIDKLRNQIQARLNSNPLKLPVVTIPVDGKNRADKILDVKGKATGGYIHGPGTSTSDSILARLSNGEFVLQAKAVRQYGLNFLNKLNSMQLPKFSGGTRVPMLPKIITPRENTSSVATLNLNLANQSFAIKTPDVDVIKALTKMVARESLKSGNI